MEQKLKVALLVATDLLSLSLAPFLALYLRLEGNISDPFFQALQPMLPLFVISGVSIFYFFRLYNRLWRYASVNEAIAIVGALITNAGFDFVFLYLMNYRLPYSLHVINLLILIMMVGGARFCVRVVHHLRKWHERKGIEKTLILGAGDAGVMIAREIQQRYQGRKELIGFLDDDGYKQNKRLLGVSVLGTCSQLPQFVERFAINEIIIAMPSVNGAVLRKIVEACQRTSCKVKIIPGLFELIDERISVQALRNVDLEDLLRRDPVRLEVEEIAAYLKGKKVMVTGAGGSIGSELCRQIARMSPAKILLMGKGENSIYEINEEIARRFPDIEVIPLIGDVRDKSAVDEAFAVFRPQVVFHAAAHKHVPLMEAQPLEAVKNNVFGTKNVAEAAERYQSEIFVMISTDKAVNPTSVMGATKRLAEMIIRNLNGKSATKFVAVRFGNVLGSRGSVIPLFKKQIAAGGPITITHPEMKRYFMTIPEASQLVLQAGSMAQGGEVFVLDMGEPVNIKDMACDLIRLSGLEPEKDITLQFTGLRPGEKLFEELLNAEEGTIASKHEKIFIANLTPMEEKRLKDGLQLLKGARDKFEVVNILKELLDTYKEAREKYQIE